MQITKCRIVKAFGHLTCHACGKIVEFELPQFNEPANDRMASILCPNCNTVTNIPLDILFNAYRNSASIISGHLSVIYRES